MVSEIEKQKSFTWKELNKTAPESRKAQWTKFKIILPEYAEIWESTEACDESGCGYANNGWCDYTDFPCGYNPYLTPRTGCPGMACMGMVPVKTEVVNAL